MKNGENGSELKNRNNGSVLQDRLPLGLSREMETYHPCRKQTHQYIICNKHLSSIIEKLSLGHIIFHYMRLYGSEY